MGRIHRHWWLEGGLSFKPYTHSVNQISADDEDEITRVHVRYVDYRNKASSVGDEALDDVPTFSQR